jgi:hypothetical protein
VRFCFLECSLRRKLKPDPDLTPGYRSTRTKLDL